MTHPANEHFALTYPLRVYAGPQVGCAFAPAENLGPVPNVCVIISITYEDIAE
jgi:hypothetical protein